LARKEHFQVGMFLLQSKRKGTGRGCIDAKLDVLKFFFSYMSMVHRSPWKTSMVIIHEIWERYNAYFEQGPQLGMGLQNIFILDYPRLRLCLKHKYVCRGDLFITR